MQAYIRGTSTFKISLKSPNVESNLVLADCTCPAAKKGNLCKHIWAALLKTEKDHIDFLDGKSAIEKSQTANGTNKTSAAVRPVIEAQELYKTKQADYKKLQYQKQKLRAQEFKKNKNVHTSPAPNQPPRAVQDAIYFFANNGFEFLLPLDALVIGVAKKKLSRIFHPDAGGTHDEIQMLNANFDILISYMKKQNV